MTTIDLNHETISINPTDDLTLYDKNNIMSRIEKFLFAICSLDSSDLPVPLSRIEELYYCLVTGDTPPTFEPLSRAEKFLMACLGAYDINKLPEPLSRSEVLLKKIATGDSNLEDVDNLQSKYEFLLAYIIQNGGIGDFDEYDLNTQFSTLYNTKERPIKSAILKGNTLVNLFGNKSHDFSQGRTPLYKLTQSLKSNTIYTVIVNVTSLNATDVRCRFKNSDDKYLTYKTITEVGIHKFTMTPNTSLIYFCPFISSEDFDNGRYAIFDDLILLEGDYTNVDIPYFEGMASVKMPVLTTTGKNLFDINGELKTTFATYSINGDSLIVTGNLFAYQDVNLKPNTTYTLSCKSVKSESGYFKLGVYYNNISNAVVALKDTKELTFTTPSTFNDISVLFYAEEGNGTNTTTYTNIQLEEGSVATPYEPFKSNILTSGKTFTQSMFEQGSFKEHTPFDTKPYDDIKINLSENSTYYSNRIRTITTHKVIPGASYKVKINDGYGIFLCFCKDGLYSKLFSESWTDTNIAVTVPTDCDEMFFALHKIDNSDITVEDYPAIGLEIRQEVTLRGIGDVKDEFNLLTGELTQRIGEIVLDGSEVWIFDDNSSLSSTNRIFTEKVIVNDAKFSPSNTLNDVGLIDLPMGTSNNDNEHICIVKGRVYIRKNKTEYSDLSAFENWLSSNPITLQYELETSTVKTVDLSVVDQDGNDTKLSTFNDITHVTLSSEGLIPEAELEVATKNEEDLEDSSVYTVHTLSEEFNTLYNTKEKPIKSAILNGNTLVNLIPNKQAKFDKENVSANAIILWDNTNVQLIKPNTKYLLIANITRNVDTRIIISNTEVAGNPCIIYDSMIYSYGETGMKKAIVTSVEDVTNCGLILRSYLLSHNNSGNINIAGTIQLIEYQEGMENWDIPYFEGMTSVKMPVLTTTSYEPFKSNILSCLEPVTLGKVGDVQDTLNVLTGEVVERTKEIVLDGTQQVYKWTGTTELTNTLAWNITVDDMTYGSTLISDKLKLMSSPSSANITDEEVVSTSVNGNRLYIRLNKSRGLTSEEVMTNLSQNPIKIQYLLKEKVHKTVDLSVVDQDGNDTKLSTFNDITHVTLSSEGLIPEAELEVAEKVPEIAASILTISREQEVIDSSTNKQSENVDATMIATTEIYEGLL